MDTGAIGSSAPTGAVITPGSGRFDPKVATGSQVRRGMDLPAEPREPRDIASISEKALRMVSYGVDTNRGSGELHLSPEELRQMISGT